jgi:outer membrane protein TolC
VVAARGVATAASPLTIEQCVDLALDRAPAVPARRRQRRRGRAGYGRRGPPTAALLRPGALRAFEGYDKAITNGGVTALGVGVEAPLLDGGQRSAELAGARARMRSATALEQQRRADVAFAVRSAYHTALAARSASEIHADTAQQLDKYVALLERQEALGAVPVTDRPRALLEVEATRSAERAAVAALTASARS